MDSAYDNRCSEGGCGNQAQGFDGRCLLHKRQTCAVPKCKNQAKNGDRCHVHKVSQSPSGSQSSQSTSTPVVRTISSAKDAYYGGGVDEPHVHVYPGCAHLKLGGDRYDLVQKGVVYKSVVARAYDALDQHPLGDVLRPWVAAAVAFFE